MDGEGLVASFGGLEVRGSGESDEFEKGRDDIRRDSTGACPHLPDQRRRLLA